MFLTCADRTAHKSRIMESDPRAERVLEIAIRTFARAKNAALAETRQPGKPPISTETVARVVAMTYAAPP